MAPVNMTPENKTMATALASAIALAVMGGVYMDDETKDWAASILRGDPNPPVRAIHEAVALLKAA